MSWRRAVLLALGLGLLVSTVKAQQPPSAADILAKAAQVNHFWLNLPYQDIGFTYQFVVYDEEGQPDYIAWVAFKAPDKAWLQELWKGGEERDELLTIIYNAGEYGFLSAKEVRRTKAFGFSVAEPIIAFKMAYQFFPPSRRLLQTKEVPFQLVGKEVVNGREAWVLEARGDFWGHMGTGVAMHITFVGVGLGGNVARLYVDCVTFALVREVVFNGNEWHQTLTYSDFQSLDGHLVPMTIAWEGLREGWEVAARLEMQIVERKVWLLKRCYGRFQGRGEPKRSLSLWTEVRDVRIVPLSNRLFDLPAFAEKPPSKPKPPQPAEELTLTGKHFRVVYPKPLEAYAKALLQIGDAAWEAYRERYGLPLPEPITLRIRLMPEQGERFARLWTDGQQSIFLEVGSEKPLLSPLKGGAHNVYGICHELAHIALYHRMREVATLPEGVAEGWPYYLGSAITSHLFEKLGEQVYPDPHNYHETSGMGRLLRQLETGKDAATIAAKALYEIERRYGAQKLGAALDRALSQRPAGHQFVLLFAEALVTETNDPQARQLIPEQLLKPQVRVETKFPDIAQKRLYQGLQMTWHDGLLQLRYDDEEKDGQMSIAGSGHGVIFVRPQGKWQLVAVEFYGARYGMPTPPDEDFRIFLCNERFEVIREFTAPYKLFATRGEWKWERIAVAPTEVPEFFYIVIAFNPTATKGIYMAYDADVPLSHSRMAYPNSHLMDTPKPYDWMIRCYLKPADEETGQRAEELVERLKAEIAAAATKQ